MSRRRSLAGFAALAVSLAATAMVVAVPLPAAAGGGPYVFPDECGPTLQQCINAHPFETIFIATETVAGDIQIPHGIALIAAQGFTPTIDGFEIQLSSGTHSVTLRGLTVANGIRANMSGGGGHTVTIERVRVEGIHPFTGAGIYFQATVSGTFHLERSTVLTVSTGGIASNVALQTNVPSGATTFRAIGNRIRQDSGDGSAGMLISHAHGGVLRVDVMNNTFWDIGACNCGNNDAIHLAAGGLASVDANVVGNTIERSGGRGITINNQVHAGGSFAVDLFDNIVAHTEGSGLLLSSTIDAPLTFRNGYNDFFVTGPNVLDGQALSSTNMSVNPRFVDRANGNLRLRPTSRLIDAGQVCTKGGIANPDAAGRHRVFGPSVDIGAYELGAPVPDGIVHVGNGTAETIFGTSGRDILCGYGAGDRLEGQGKPDYVDGGDGGDVIFGDGGADRMFGRKGADLLCARDGKGNDLVDGGQSTDTYSADRGDTLISVETGGPCS